MHILLMFCYTLSKDINTASIGELFELLETSVINRNTAKLILTELITGGEISPKQVR